MWMSEARLRTASAIIACTSLMIGACVASPAPPSSPMPARSTDLSIERSTDLSIDLSSERSIVRSKLLSVLSMVLSIVLAAEVLNSESWIDLIRPRGAKLVRICLLRR